MVSVCVPFLFIIFVLQTRRGMEAAKQVGRVIDRVIDALFNPHRLLPPREKKLQRLTAKVQDDRKRVRRFGRKRRTRLLAHLPGGGGAETAAEAGGSGRDSRRAARWRWWNGRRPAAQEEDMDKGEAAV